VILHFLVGIGFLVYKLAGPVKKTEVVPEKKDES
jgi:hypothetical protein